MEYHDVRGKELGYISQIVNRFPAGVYNEHSHTYNDEVTENDIDSVFADAHDSGADMVLVQEYGIAYYVPINK